MKAITRLITTLSLIFGLVQVGSAQTYYFFTPDETYTFQSLNRPGGDSLIVISIVFDADTNATITKDVEDASEDDAYKIGYFGPSVELTISSVDTIHEYTLSIIEKYWIVLFNDFDYSQKISATTTITCECTAGTNGCDTSTLKVGNVATTTCIPQAGCSRCKMNVKEGSQSINQPFLILKAASVSM